MEPLHLPQQVVLLVVRLLLRRPRRKKKKRVQNSVNPQNFRISGLTYCVAKEESDEDMGFGLFD